MAEETVGSQVPADGSQAGVTRVDGSPSDEQPSRQVQEHEWSPPSEPARGGGGPNDALEPVVAAPAEVPQYSERRSPTVGPEDAMDPLVLNRGDYSARVEDAAHFTHRPIGDITEVEPGEPLSAPVAQNELAANLVPGAEAGPDGGVEHRGRARPRRVDHHGVDREHAGERGEDERAAHEQEPTTGLVPEPELNPGVRPAQTVSDETRARAADSLAGVEDAGGDENAEPAV